MEALHVYHDWMFWLQEQLGGDDILHVNVGMALWLMTVLLRQNSLRDRTNLLPLAVLEMANEAVDFIIGGGWTLGDTITDILLTMLWPVIVTEIARSRARVRVVKKVKRSRSETDGPPDLEEHRPERRKSERIATQSSPRPIEPEHWPAG